VIKDAASLLALAGFIFMLWVWAQILGVGL
jgi:hypothetical protein